MSKLTYLESLKFEGDATIVLIKGAVADGSAFYAYIKMNAEEYSHIKELNISGEPFVLTDLGYILHSEMKAEPPEYVVEHIKDEYNL